MSIIHTYNKSIRVELNGDDSKKGESGRTIMINQLISGVLRSCPGEPVPALLTP